MAILLAIEGADGAGKATTAAAVAAALNEAGRRAIVVSFPRYTETAGGWALGEFLAGRLPRQTTPQAAAVLYALDRLESRAHVAALAADHDVLVFDRYIASNMAYQGAQVPAGEAATMMDWVWALETIQFALPPPDLSIYLDTPADVSRRFIELKARRSYTGRTFDEYEADQALQSRVRTNYARLAQENRHGRWATVQVMDETAPRPPKTIAAEIAALF